MPSFVTLFRQDHTELVYKGRHQNGVYYWFSAPPLRPGYSWYQSKNYQKLYFARTESTFCISYFFSRCQSSKKWCQSSINWRQTSNPCRRSLKIRCWSLDFCRKYSLFDVVKKINLLSFRNLLIPNKLFSFYCRPHQLLRPRGEETTLSFIKMNNY